MEMVAREIIPPLRNGGMFHGEVGDEDEDDNEDEDEDDDEYEDEDVDVDVVVPELVNELPRDPRVVLERRNTPIPPADREASALEPIAFALPYRRLQLVNARDDPPPRYTREPATPRQVSSCAGRDSGRSLTQLFSGCSGA